MTEIQVRSFLEIIRRHQMLSMQLEEGYKLTVNTLDESIDQSIDILIDQIFPEIDDDLREELIEKTIKYSFGEITINEIMSTFGEMETMLH